MSVYSAADMRRHISRWCSQERLVSDGSACTEVWTMSGTSLPLTYTHWDQEQPGRVQTLMKHTGRRCILGPPVCFSPATGDGSCVAVAADVIGGFWDDREILLLLRETQAGHHPAHQSPNSSSITRLRRRLDGPSSFQKLLQGCDQFMKTDHVTFPALNCWVDWL